MIVLASPWWFLLLPLPVLLHRVMSAYEHRQDAVRAPFTNEIAELMGHRDRERVTAPRTRAQTALFVIAWLLTIAALARPQFIGDPIEKSVPTRDMLLAVDLSGSMDAEDFETPEGERIRRLDAVKEVLDEFLMRREGDRVALIVFGSAAYLQSPFTDDLDACRALLAETRVGMAGPKTVVGDAIGLAINVFESSDLEERVLILLTDGNDTGSRVPPMRAAEIASERGIVVHTVAVGDPTSVGEEQIDTVSLQQIAGASGGSFARADDLKELEAVYARLDELTARDVETITHRPRRDLYHWPLACMFLLLFGFHLAQAGPRWARSRRGTG